jgi:hypothetical protein
VRASLISQQLIEYSEVRTGGPPQRRYRLKPQGNPSANPSPRNELEGAQ